MAGPEAAGAPPVYTCLSHDVVGHETTHAVLDGLRRRFLEPSLADQAAFHEGFADIVALMQHFTMPDVLANEIARSRGNLEEETMLGSLAVQFGYGQTGRGALRDAIGRLENGTWKRLKPDPAELEKRLTPHGRGAILVAAVFDPFLAIYRARTADLLRIFRAIDEADQDLLGIFHSHVYTQAYPSQTDVRLAYYPDAIYFLVSLANERQPVLKGYTIVDGQIDEIEVLIEP